MSKGLSDIEGLTVVRVRGKIGGELMMKLKQSKIFVGIMLMGEGSFSS